MKSKSTLLFLSMLLLVLMIGVPTAQSQFRDLDEGNPDEVYQTFPAEPFTIADPGQKAFGETYGQWASDWWEWVLQFPIAENPLFDETGELCALGDQGSVWFLVGNFGGTTVRECTAPVGKAFFFPIFNVISFAPEFGTTVEEIRMDANNDVDYELDPDPTISCEIDGVLVDDLFAYRAQSPRGGFELTSDALLIDFGLDPGPRFPAISDGYWIMLKGLGPGAHEIHIEASAPGGFFLDVTYFLTLGN